MLKRETEFPKSVKQEKEPPQETSFTLVNVIGGAVLFVVFSWWFYGLCWLLSEAAK